MTTPITVDTTLISAIISAAVAILVACGTVIWITKSNRKLEENKLKNAKKEELFHAIIEINRAMYRYYACFNLALNSKQFHLELIDEKRDSAIARLGLLSNIYFNNLELSALLESIFKYEQENVMQIRAPYYNGSMTYEKCNLAKENYDEISLETSRLKMAVNKL